MKWTELLKAEIDSAYAATDKLLAKTDDSMLGWKPSSGANWMTTGQLLMHLSSSCGQPFRGFITGDWGMPEGVDTKDMSPEEMLPPAEKMPAVTTVAETKKLLQQDKKTALEALAKCSEEDLAKKPAPAPWEPTPMILGQRLLQMIDHLKAHKGQLFYYLKLQGKPVNTADYWGM
jgi:uncharacterized damage-inducible protein DinB